MDSKTEPASEAKERIEREGKQYANPDGWGEGWNDRLCGYIAGATAEYNRAQEEITRLKAGLERERELRKEIVRLVHKFQYDTKVSLISEIQSLIEKSKN